MIHAHFGRGRIDCGRGGTILYTSRRNIRLKRYKLTRCTRISFHTLGY